MPTNNMPQLLQTAMQSGNPQQFTMNLLQQYASQNPMFSNMLALAQGGDVAALTQMAKNVCKERGLDFDSNFENFKRMFGVK